MAKKATDSQVAVGRAGVHVAHQPQMKVTGSLRFKDVFGIRELPKTISATVVYQAAARAGKLFTTTMD